MLCPHAEFPSCSGIDLMNEIRNDEMLSEVVGDKLVHSPPSREKLPHHRTHTPDRRRHGLPRNWRKQGLTATDRVMICGSMEMLRDCADLCEAAGLVEARNQPGDYVIERLRTKPPSQQAASVGLLRFSGKNRCLRAPLRHRCKVGWASNPLG